MDSLGLIPIGTSGRFVDLASRRARHPERCSDLGARLLDTMMLLLATTCFVHAHDVSQSRSRRASRRAVCLTPVIDAAEAQNIMSTKAAREVLTTDAMNHLVSFGPCINSCRLPALAPIHSPCPEWSCNVCLYLAPCPCSRSGVRHVVCVSMIRVYVIRVSLDTTSCHRPQQQIAARPAGPVPLLRSNKVPPDRIHSQRACER